MLQMFVEAHCCTSNVNAVQVVAKDVDKMWTEILARGQIFVILYL